MLVKHDFETPLISEEKNKLFTKLSSMVHFYFIRGRSAGCDSKRPDMCLKLLFHNLYKTDFVNRKLASQSTICLYAYCSL